MMKLIYIMAMTALLSACTKTEYQDIIREVEPEKPLAVYYYYSYKAAEVVNAATLGYASDEFIPGRTYIYGDTLFIANTQAKHFSVELYSLSARKKIGSLNQWTYKDETQVFNNYVEAIAVSDGKLFLANIGSCIDVFDVRTLGFVTRMGNRNWGEGNTQFLHTHAMVIVGDYIVVRMKNRLQVMLKSSVVADKYQNIPFFSRGSAAGFDTNNGFYPHQMAVDSLGTIFLADYGQYGNRKIQVIDPALIKKGDNIVMTDEKRTMSLNFNPRGIALYKNMMYISASDGSIRIYDRKKEKFLQTIQSVIGYTFRGAQKMLVKEDRLWVTDVTTKEVVGVDIIENTIEVYD